MPLQNYTTTISAMQTIAEIMAMLARHGARRIETVYGDDGQPTGLTFVLISHGKEIQYRRDARADAVKRILTRQKAGSKRASSIKADDEQAIRTAWRNIKDLLTAQMTMIEYEQEDAEELFLPKSVQENGKTLFENYRERLLLTESKPEIPECFRRLGFSEIPDNEEAIKEKYRELSKITHPDSGGSEAAFRELTGYYEAALAAVRGGSK